MDFSPSYLEPQPQNQLFSAEAGLDGEKVGTEDTRLESEVSCNRILYQKKCLNRQPFHELIQHQGRAQTERMKKETKLQSG